MEIFDKRYVTFVFVRTEKISYRCAKKTTSPFFSFNFFEINLSRCMLGRKASIKNVRIEKEPKRRYHESF